MSNSRYAQIFTFLKEYYKLRETTVYDVFSSRKYPRSLAWHELQESPNVRSWLGGDNLPKDEQLFYMKKPVAPVAPEKPKIHEKLKPWLNRPEIEIEQQPSLKPSYQPHPSIESSDVLLLTETPKPVESSFVQLLNQWQQWQEEYKAYHRQLEIYQRDKKNYDLLFHCANTLRASGEKFEFVLGLGLFTLKAHKVIRRPIVTLPLDLSIEDSGQINATLDPSYKIENAVLMGMADFQIAHATTRLRTIMDAEQDDFTEMIQALRATGLAAFANTLSADCSYREWVEDPLATSSQPRLSFTPILLLRERGLSGFATLFENLLNQITQNKAAATPLLDRLVYSVLRKPTNNQSLLGTANDRGDIIFPKKTNKEQQKIVEKILREDMVLVQGPPGTGKSHAIANMVIYLLSQGQKVLVTAQTDQALNALKHHIPTNFWDLVIFLLQDDNSSDYKLEKSVGSLLKSISDYDASSAQSTILQNEHTLASLSDEKRVVIEQIRKQLAQNSQRFTINPHFTDLSLLDWCQRVIGRTAAHFWLQDEIAEPGEFLELWPPLKEWQTLHRNISASELPPPGKLPNLDRLPAPEDFDQYRKQKEIFLQQKQQLGIFPIRPIDAEKFRQKTQEWSDARDQIAVEQSPWIESVQVSIRSKETALWQDRLDQTKQFLDQLHAGQTLELLKSYDVYIPENTSYKQLREDVAMVMNYLKSGNDLTATFSRLVMPRPIRKRQYVFKSCTINGQPCNDWGRLSILAKIIEVGFELSNLDELWHPYHITQTNTHRKIVAYREKIEKLQQQLIHYPPYIKSQQYFEKLYAEGDLDWQNPEIANVLTQTAALLLQQQEIDAFEKKIQNGLAYLGRYPEDHVLVAPIRKALQTTDVSLYHQQFEQVIESRDVHRQVTERDALEAHLKKWIPQSLSRLRDQQLNLTLEGFTKAVYWAHAKSALEKLMEGKVDHQFTRLAKVEARQQAIAGDYLKIKALKAFTESIDSVDLLNQHLTRWQQAVRQGAGSGKMSYKYRREAQKKLTEISKSIPCWVMPLYRMVETIDPQPGMFDVVIVDEASQLGPEAIFFNYIAKKVVVVGDDQQTAPENVGVDLQSVQNLIHTHLSDVPDRAYFDTKHSFFDHMKAVSGQPITLREHFRCMPEIIAFSNQICYRDLGIDLIPLRPISRDRLAPLKKYFVENGQFEQDHNPSEANAIVQTIQLLIQDEGYRDKTFGVISLQGEEQAAAIDHQLRQSIPIKDYLSRKIRCGTAPDFQGDERDIVFLSLVTAPNHRRSALTKRAFRRRYNVAMSRAKQQVWLFHSVQVEDLDKRDLRWQLLNFFGKQEQSSGFPAAVPSLSPAENLPAPFNTSFEYAIYRALTEKGWEVVPKVKIGPYSIDLVVHLKNGQQLAVSCDGDEELTAYQVQQKIEHQRVLERSGWQYFHINQVRFLYDPEGVLAELEASLV